MAWAAEPEQGRFLRGQVTAIEGTTLIVKTPDGERQVTTSDETRFHIRGVEDPTIADVKVGDYILARVEPEPEWWASPKGTGSRPRPGRWTWPRQKECPRERSSAEMGLIRDITRLGFR